MKNLIFRARDKRLTPNQKPTTTYLTIEHKLQNIPVQCTHCRLQPSHVFRSQKTQVTRNPHLDWRQLWHLKVSSTCKVLFWTAWAFLSRSEPSFINSRVLAAREGMIVSRNSGYNPSFKRNTSTPVPTVNTVHIVRLFEVKSINVGLKLKWGGSIERKLSFRHLWLWFRPNNSKEIFTVKTSWFYSLERTENQPSDWLNFRAKLHADHFPDLAHDN